MRNWIWCHSMRIIGLEVLVHYIPMTYENCGCDFVLSFPRFAIYVVSTINGAKVSSTIHCALVHRDQHGVFLRRGLHPNGSIKKVFMQTILIPLGFRRNIQLGNLNIISEPIGHKFDPIRNDSVLKKYMSLKVR